MSLPRNRQMNHTPAEALARGARVRTPAVPIRNPAVILRECSRAEGIGSHGIAATGRPPQHVTYVQVGLDAVQFRRSYRVPNYAEA
jgi:hypothetical protein